MFISEEIRNFVRNTFFFGGMEEVATGYENGNYTTKRVADYKLSDEWAGDAMIDWLEENGVIFRFDDDYYHIEEVFLNQFFSDKEVEEDKANWMAKINK